jgi:hypothetical protein
MSLRLIGRHSQAFQTSLETCPETCPETDVKTYVKMSMWIEG